MLNFMATVQVGRAQAEVKSWNLSYYKSGASQRHRLINIIFKQESLIVPQLQRGLWSKEVKYLTQRRGH